MHAICSQLILNILPNNLSKWALAVQQYFMSQKHEKYSMRDNPKTLLFYGVHIFFYKETNSKNCPNSGSIQLFGLDNLQKTLQHSKKSMLKNYF